MGIRKWAQNGRALGTKNVGKQALKNEAAQISEILKTGHSQPKEAPSAKSGGLHPPQVHSAGLDTVIKKVDSIDQRLDQTTIALEQMQKQLAGTEGQLSETKAQLATIIEMLQRSD